MIKMGLDPAAMPKPVPVGTKIVRDTLKMGWGGVKGIGKALPGFGKASLKGFMSPVWAPIASGAFTLGKGVLGAKRTKYY